MPPLLSLSHVADAVVELSAEDGVKSVTARALAARLHVSVGALYNYAGSMQAALAAGEVTVGQVIEQSHLIDDGIAGLLAWADANPGHASLFFDPSRTHEYHQPVGRAMCGEVLINSGDVQVCCEDTRAMVGVLQRSSELTLVELAPSVEIAIAEYTSLKMRLASTPAPRRESPDHGTFVAAVEDQIDRLEGLSDRALLLRRESAAMLLDPELSSWSFRSLADRTGIALAALHAAGSRSAHIERAVEDIGLGLIASALEFCDGDAFEAITTIPAILRDHCVPMLDDGATLVTVQSIGKIVERSGWIDGPFGTENKLVLSRSAMLLALFIAGNHRRKVDHEQWMVAMDFAAAYAEFVSQGSDLRLS